MSRKKIRLKVCGMREPGNIAGLVQLNPDFLGFIFHEVSPRYCRDVPQVEIPETILKTGVFVDKPLEYIALKKEAFGLDLIQLHGHEDPAFCRKVSEQIAPVMKAFRVDESFAFEQTENYAPFCRYFLFDTAGPLAGGNGRPFRWELLEKYNGTTPFLLSGGIDGTMVEKLRALQHPAFYGVDINSRFETSPGVKNIQLIKQFQHELLS